MNEISEVTRRTIMDHLLASQTIWSGRLPEDDFLGRLYKLASMPSTDHRLSDAAADIRQHRQQWTDWPDDWVFTDSRFNLLWGPDADFLRFLCETIHPVVRVDPGEVASLLNAYNAALAQDAWILVEIKQISGRPVYVGRKLGQRAQVFNEPTGWQKVDRQAEEVRERLKTADTVERYQAVGLLCREVLITVAQETYNPAKHAISGGVQPSPTDAHRMLEGFFAVELGGGENEEARAHAKAALKLTLALQHKRTADFKMAALCAEATLSVVNILAVLGGRRGRSL